MAKQPWTVRYRLFGSKKDINRHFPNERQARAYYKKLFFRSNMPEVQAIFPKGSQ